MTHSAPEWTERCREEEIPIRDPQLVVNPFDIVHRVEEDIKQVRVEMLSTLSQHQIFGMLELIRRLVHPLSREGIEVVGNGA